MLYEYIISRIRYENDKTKCGGEFIRALVLQRLRENSISVTDTEEFREWVEQKNIMERGAENDN